MSLYHLNKAKTLSLGLQKVNQGKHQSLLRVLRAVHNIAIEVLMHFIVLWSLEGITHMLHNLDHTIHEFKFLLGHLPSLGPSFFFTLVIRWLFAIHTKSSSPRVSISAT
jgi:hypothetical protein